MSRGRSLLAFANDHQTDRINRILTRLTQIIIWLRREEDSHLCHDHDACSQKPNSIQIQIDNQTPHTT